MPPHVPHVPHDDARICRAPPRMTFVAFALLVLALALAPSPAMAQERARDYVQPRITRAQFQKLCQDIGLESNQKQIAGVAFSDYEAAMDDLVKRLDAEALAAGRSTVDDSLSGKARVASDELQRL